MAQPSMISEEMRKMIGKEFVRPMVFEIEKGAIRKLAEAIEDDNPLWQDEAHARKTKYGSIIAPPLFFCSLGLGELQKQQNDLPVPYGRVLAEGAEYEYYLPVKVGDVLTATTKLADLQERDTRLGRMLLITTEKTLTNQKGEMVAKERVGLYRY